MKYTDEMKNLKDAFEDLSISQLGYIKSAQDEKAIKYDCDTFHVTREEWNYVLEDAIEAISGIWN